MPENRPAENPPTLRPDQALQVFKPDLDEANRRWQAFYAGEIIDRPPVCVTAPRPGFPPPAAITYHDKVFYCTWAATQSEAEALLAWFVENT